MQNLLTPTEFQELINNKTVAAMVKKADLMPSKMVLSIVLGYSSALLVFKTKQAGKVSLLLN